MLEVVRQVQTAEPFLKLADSLVQVLPHDAEIVRAWPWAGPRPPGPPPPAAGSRARTCPTRNGRPSALAKRGRLRLKSSRPSRRCSGMIGP
ncbi:MAG: hypothetical protein WKF75_10540 [Singulisphaera sp.]